MASERAQSPGRREFSCRLWRGPGIDRRQLCEFAEPSFSSSADRVRMRDTESRRTVGHVRDRVLVLGDGLHVRAMIDQILDQLVVADISRAVQRRVALGVHRVHIGPQLRRNISPRPSRCNPAHSCCSDSPSRFRQRPQRRVAAERRDVGIRAVRDQQLHGGNVASTTPRARTRSRRPYPPRNDRRRTGTTVSCRASRSGFGAIVEQRLHQFQIVDLFFAR